MESWLAQCSSYLLSEQPVLLSILLAGLVGSISHCSTMCSPLVAANMLELREKERPQWQMLYYHAGRISTYVLLGISALYLKTFLFSDTFGTVSQFILLIAGLTFITSALFPRKTHHCCSAKSRSIQRWIDQTFSTSTALYFRGLLMGFMPCGMTLSILLMVSTFQQPVMAAIAMFLFGLSTVPMLQIAGYGALTLTRNRPKLAAHAGRSIMALNGLWLCAIGLNFSA